MSDEEIIANANLLAAALYRLRGYQARPGHRFDQATHPHETEAWQGAVVAFALLTGTDVEDALSNIEA